MDRPRAQAAESRGPSGKSYRRDKPLPKPVRFPSPATKAEAWTRAPVARVLPNQWIVLGYKNGRLVVNVKGRADSRPAGDRTPIRRRRPSSINSAIDEGMKWMVDFDAAEKVGWGFAPN